MTSVPLSSCTSRSSCGSRQDSLSLLWPSSDDTSSSVRLLRSRSSSVLLVFFFGLHHGLLRRASRMQRSATARTQADTSFQELAFDPSSTLTAHLSLEISSGHSTVCAPLHGMYSTLVPNHFQSNAVCTTPGHVHGTTQPCQAVCA